MKKILVISYSLGGTTRYLADEIAKELRADTAEIADPTPRGGMWGYVQAGFESLARGLPSIIVDCEPADYDFVVLGTPVWAGSMSSPMRAFLFEHAQKIHNAACFCTMGGNGAQQTLREMKALLRAPNAPTLAMGRSDMRKGRRQLKLSEFVDEVRGRARATRVSAVS